MVCRTPQQVLSLVDLTQALQRINSSVCNTRVTAQTAI
jgi:hypothetical protein